jgi:hypothetical protein
MSDVKALYDNDFVLWSKEQAEALRAVARGATNQPIDWENVAEEIDSLGRSDRRELGSQVRRIIEHLLKLEYSRAAAPRRGWVESIGHARNEIEVLLEDSPSLKSEVVGVIGAEMKRASRKVLRDLQGHGELDRTSTTQISAGFRRSRHAANSHAENGGDTGQPATYII